MGILIKTNSNEIVTPKNGKEFTLEELQTFVGGHIELVMVIDGRAMFCNEEGKLQNLPVNEVATMMVQAAGIHDTIVGDVIVCNPGEYS